MYNPYQSRLDSLMQQRNMIDNQLNSLQQYQQMPNININNMTPTGNYDFNGRWVNSAEEAKNLANNNLPSIFLDRNNPVFYMKNMDGTFRTFKFEEVIEQPQPNNDERINALEDKLNTILNALQQPSDNNTTKQQAKPQTAKKEVK